MNFVWYDANNEPTLISLKDVTIRRWKAVAVLVITALFFRLYPFGIYPDFCDTITILTGFFGYPGIVTMLVATIFRQGKLNRVLTIAAGVYTSVILILTPTIIADQLNSSAGAWQGLATWMCLMLAIPCAVTTIVLLVSAICITRSQKKRQHLHHEKDAL